MALVAIKVAAVASYGELSVVVEGLPPPDDDYGRTNDAERTDGLRTDAAERTDGELVVVSILVRSSLVIAGWRVSRNEFFPSTLKVGSPSVAG